MARLIISEEPVTPVTNPYEHLGLRDNPFPIDGIVNRASPDPRVNGTIFAPEIRQQVIRDFERKLLGVGNPEQRYRLGYLWAEGDLTTGRGVGKTAILLYLQRRINADWGESYFQGKFSVCALYTTPQPGTKKLEYVAVLALRELVTQKVLDSVLTTLRYKVITSGLIEGDTAAVRALSPDEVNNLLDGAWLKAHGFDFDVLNEQVVALLASAGVEEWFTHAVANNDLLTYLKAMRRDQQQDWTLPSPRDVGLFRRANNLFFTQAVRTLKAAGFRGAYLFVDDIENVVDQMGRRERETFAKELRYVVLGGDYEAAMSRFVTVVLTTHAASAQRLSEAWGFAGLQTSLPMSLDAENSILVPALNLAEAKEVMKRYLAYYHITEMANPFHPFTEDAIEKLVQAHDYHPRRFLSRTAEPSGIVGANGIIEKAHQDPARTQIDAAFVEVCLKDTTRMVSGADEPIDATVL